MSFLITNGSGIRALFKRNALFPYIWALGSAKGLNCFLKNFFEGSLVVLVMIITTLAVMMLMI